MSDDDHEFTTDSLGEQPYETTVNDAVAFFKEALADEGGYYGAQMQGTLRSWVRMALNARGVASPETLADAAHTLDEQADQDADVEPILRRLEAMTSESDPGRR